MTRSHGSTNGFAVGLAPFSNYAQGMWHDGGGITHSLGFRGFFPWLDQQSPDPSKHLFGVLAVDLNKIWDVDIFVLAVRRGAPAPPPASTTRVSRHVPRDAIAHPARKPFRPHPRPHRVPSRDSGSFTWVLLSSDPSLASLTRAQKAIGIPLCVLVALGSCSWLRRARARRREQGGMRDGPEVSTKASSGGGASSESISIA